MIIEDRIYGKIEITQNVIEELIHSKPLQRLRKISQDGAPHFIQPVRNVSRFEHSIGVWYLSYKFGRSIEEQIACLLHDTPHTAFSHVIDFVMKDSKHEFHEKFTEKIIIESEIPQVLKKYKVSIDKVLNKEKFILLENDLPDISFDRWDYFMRDGFAIGFLPKLVIDSFLKGIHLKNQRLYFLDAKLASLYAILFLNFSRLIWLDPTSHGSFFLISEALKVALDKNIISQDDFFTNDEILLKKSKQSKNKEIISLLNRLKPGREFVYASKSEAEFFGPNKPRTVDPWVLSDNKFARVSKTAPSLSYYIEQFNKDYKYLGVNQT